MVARRHANVLTTLNIVSDMANLNMDRLMDKRKEGGRKGEIERGSEGEIERGSEGGGEKYHLCG